MNAYHDPGLFQAGATAADKTRRFVGQMLAVDDTPLVFLPGLFETPAIWTPLHRRMADRFIHNLDLPGHLPGERPAQLSRDLPSGEAVRTLSQRLNAASGGRPCHLVGHSSGGLLALMLAAREPGLIASLVLVGTPFAGHRGLRRDAWAELLKRERLVRWMLPTLWRGGLSSRARFRRILRSVLPEDALPRVPDGMRLALMRCDPQAVRQFAAWVLAQDATGLLQEVSVPALVIIGRDDRVVPARHQIDLLKALPRAQARIVPGGHLPFVEHPVAFERTLRAWMAQPRGLPEGPASENTLAG